MPICKFCSGEAKLVSEKEGKRTYKCVYCGNTYEEEVEKPVVKAVEKPVQFTQPVQPTQPVNKDNGILSGQDIYQKLDKSAVEIYTESGCASGFFVSELGFLVTNAHVVLHNGVASKQIKVCNKGGKLMDAKLLAVGSPDGNGIDLALLFVPEMLMRAEPVTLADSSKVKNGERVYYMGNSKGEGMCITSGIVSDNCRKDGSQKYIMTDVATNPGNSGGPLINEHGEVIGIHVSAKNKADGMKYAIPSNTLKEFIGYVEDGSDLETQAIVGERRRNELATAILSGVKILADVIAWVIDFCSKMRAREK